MSYRIEAMPDAVLAEVRRSGRDVSGHPVESVVAGGGESLRCCLRDAEAGEEIILFGYEPRLPPSPYQERGAVFAHRTDCAGPEPVLPYPPGWYGRSQVLRAYDERGRIHPASRVHDGADPEAALREVFAEPGVVLVHSRNVAYGCYMFAAVRE